jgi:hypothetical protein
MKIQRTLTHDIPPAEVYSMSCLPEYQERKCADAGALSWKVSVLDEGAGTVIKTRRKLPTVGFPSLLRKLLPEGILSTETIHWAPDASADGTRTATLDVDFHGAPIKLHGNITLSPEGDGGSLIEVDAVFSASIPLVGGKVEKLSAPIIIGVIDSEQETGRAWAATA